MIAVILAAGLGSRLGDITNQTPKPMLKINNKPILEHNIIMCKKHGIEDLFINTHYLSEIISNYFGNGESYGVKIKYSHEKNILGTAGAIYPLMHYIKKDFFVIYGDNYSNADLTSLANFHYKNDSDFTILVHRKKNIKGSGVLEFDNNLRVTNFIEKPKSNVINSNWVNAGIYLIKPHIIKNEIREGSDFGSDVIPKLIKNNSNVFAYKLTSKLIAIDTPDLFFNTLENK